MRSIARVAALAALLGCAGSALALGVRVEDCTKPQAGLELLDRHPELAQACEAVIQLDGRRYLQLGAALVQRDAGLLVLRLNGSERDLVLAPGAAEPLVAAAGSLPATLGTGSPLSLYVPEDRVLEAFADAETLGRVQVPVVVESDAERQARIANYTCCPRRRPWYPIVDVLPTTAAPPPLLGLLGAGLIAVAALLRRRRLAGR